ncbi:MAG: methylated-DNA--[protein]-cysteine S-methyltransferase [Firmicutes bacterium]|nr:methylated-DNA--[protein]-cysteine S-methyltransferase [Bacillota bacterium]
MTHNYRSPLGEILLSADDSGLTGLWFSGQKYFPDRLPEDMADPTAEHHLDETVRWLDLYFVGQKPDFIPKLHPAGTAFQQLIWSLLLDIPYGKTATYGDLAKQVSILLGRPHMSAQAVGGAVGHNPISIIIPCHRVLGAKGQMTGYASGIWRKEKLLTLESAALDLQQTDKSR